MSHGLSQPNLHENSILREIAIQGHSVSRILGALKTNDELYVPV